jgi:hypothetical protein
MGRKIRVCLPSGEAPKGKNLGLLLKKLQKEIINGFSGRNSQDVNEKREKDKLEKEDQGSDNEAASLTN